MAKKKIKNKKNSKRAFQKFKKVNISIKNDALTQVRFKHFYADKLKKCMYVRPGGDLITNDSITHC